MRIANRCEFSRVGFVYELVEVEYYEPASGRYEPFIAQLYDAGRNRLARRAYDVGKVLVGKRQRQPYTLSRMLAETLAQVGYLVGGLTVSSVQAQVFEELDIRV